MYDLQRYKIDTLLKMAKTTNSDYLREKYIAEADIELQSLTEENGVCSSNSVENFIDECIVQDFESSIERTTLYRKYIEYCKRQNVSFATRNALYRYLREKGMYSQKKVDGTFFLIGLKLTENDI